MKQILFAIFGFILFSSFKLSTGTAILHIEVKGIEKSKGKLYVGLFRKKDKFPEIKGQFKGILVNAQNPKTTLTIEDLPPDTYALAVFHDLNENNILDKNLLGVPVEIYGFSNNARRTFSAPSFEEAAFELKKERKLEISLR
jgi:uncharacterized protein (DUF2141 family)